MEWFSESHKVAPSLSHPQPPWFCSRQVTESELVILFVCAESQNLVTDLLLLWSYKVATSKFQLAAYFMKYYKYV